MEGTGEEKTARTGTHTSYNPFPTICNGNTTPSFPPSPSLPGPRGSSPKLEPTALSPPVPTALPFPFHLGPWTLDDTWEVLECENGEPDQAGAMFNGQLGTEFESEMNV